MTTDRKRLVLFIFFSTILLYFILAPGINLLYYRHDDFRYAFGGLTKACRLDDGFEFMLTLGRPLQAYLDCLSFKFAYTLERMQIIRMLSALLLGTGMGLFADYLLSLGIPIAGALFGAGSLFLIQRLSDEAITAGALSLPFSLILVLLAYRFFSSQYQIKKYWVISAILLFCALLTYPAMGFFFPVLALLQILFSKWADWKNTRYIITQAVVLFFSVCIIYFLWSNYNMHYHALAPIPPAYQLSHPNINPLEAIHRFFLLSDFFSNIWRLSPLDNMIINGWISLILILAGLTSAIIYFHSHLLYPRPASALKQLMQMAGYILGLLALSSAFFLVMPNLSLVEPRVLFGTIASGFAMLFWCIMQLGRSFFAIFFCSLFLYEGYATNIYLLATASSYVQAIQSTREDIASFLKLNTTIRRIHVIVAKPAYPYDHFFITNTALEQVLGRGQYQVAWCSLPRGVPGEEKDHQQEMLACLNHLPNNDIAVTYSYIGEPFTTTPAMLLINRPTQTVNANVSQYLANYMKKSIDENCCGNIAIKA